MCLVCLRATVTIAKLSRLALTGVETGSYYPFAFTLPKFVAKLPVLRYGLASVVVYTVCDVPGSHNLTDKRNAYAKFF